MFHQIGNLRPVRLACGLALLIVSANASAAGFCYETDEVPYCEYNFYDAVEPKPDGLRRPATGLMKTYRFLMTNPNGLSDIEFIVRGEGFFNYSEIYYDEIEDMWYRIGGGSGIGMDFRFSDPYSQFFWQYTYLGDHKMFGSGVNYKKGNDFGIIDITIFMSHDYDGCPGEGYDYQGSGRPYLPYGVVCANSLTDLEWRVSAVALGDNRDTFRFSLLRVSSYQIVPEPASWAMMIAGFGLVGGGLRMRRRREAPNIGAPQLAG